MRTDLTCVEAMTPASQTQFRTELSQLVMYLYEGSLKKFSEMKLTSYPLSLARAVTENW